MASGWVRSIRPAVNQMTWQRGQTPGATVSGPPDPNARNPGVWLRMEDGNDRWYDGLIEELERVHHGRTIEKCKNLVAMRMRGHGANDFP
ncbi:Alpha-L-arabinofuranosidase 1 [Hordeum vulgare]|nr:Alpha-L-arabinofuranosidase 1 [Hordeum vulgare]